MFSQEVPCRSSASNASCFRFASALGIHDEYSDVLFSLLTLFTMCCLWFATTLPFACQWMRALLSSFVNCRQGVWKWNGSGFCFSESTSSMPVRDWQCQGQSFLLLVLSSASPNLHPPCLQEIGSVEGNPFYCLCSLRTMCFCKALCAPKRLAVSRAALSTACALLHLRVLRQ